MNRIIEAIDRELSHLNEIRALLIQTRSPKLSNALATLPLGKRGGRPAGSKKAPKQPAAPVERTLSPEGRARIAAAQKKRWATAKKAA